MHPQIIPQLERLLGRQTVAPLGIATGEAISPAQLAALHNLLAGRTADLAAALLAEAAASDDVTDAASALAYLEDRLAFFAEVMTPDLAVAIRAAFARGAERWG